MNKGVPPSQPEPSERAFARVEYAVRSRGNIEAAKKEAVGEYTPSGATASQSLPTQTMMSQSQGDPFGFDDFAPPSDTGIPPRPLPATSTTATRNRVDPYGGRRIRTNTKLSEVFNEMQGTAPHQHVGLSATSGSFVVGGNDDDDDIVFVGGDSADTIGSIASNKNVLLKEMDMFRESPILDVMVRNVEGKPEIADEKGEEEEEEKEKEEEEEEEEKEEEKEGEKEEEKGEKEKAEKQPIPKRRQLRDTTREDKIIAELLEMSFTMDKISEAILTVKQEKRRRLTIEDVIEKLLVEPEPDPPGLRWGRKRISADFKQEEEDDGYARRPVRTSKRRII